MHESYTMVDDCDGAPDGHGNRWILYIGFGDQGEQIVLPMGVDEIFALHTAMETSGAAGYIREYLYHQREWRRMTPVERAGAAGEETDPDAGYALDDPKHPTYHERMVGDA